MQVVQKFLDVDGSRLSYHQVEPFQADKPALVLAHGLSDSGLCWPEVLSALHADYQIYLPSARGHGLSARLGEGEFTSAQRVADLLALISALKLDKPILMGHSMGAMTIADLAAQYPNLLRAIILEDPPWFTGSRQNRPRPEAAKDYRAWLADSQSQTLTDLMTKCQTENPAWPPSVFHPWAESKQQVDPNTAQLYSEVLNPWQETATKITCSMLLITGGNIKRQRIVTKKTAQAVMKLTPAGQWVYLAKAGHNIRRECLPEYLAAVQDFLQNV